ncbi:MAG TPA: phosphonate ABC transporter, permease protein PhnE [Chloroflexia bacterium]|nr:phosphonate ABC transporter, permease protein PhnE [Chloroflexia bacterium]
MAVIDESVPKQKPGTVPGASPPIPKRPRPLFLRSWPALVALAIIIVAEVYGWQVAEINPPKLVAKWGEFQSRFGELLAPDIIAQDQKQLQVPLPIVGAETPPVQVKPATVEAPIKTVIKKSGADQNLVTTGADIDTFNVTLSTDSDTVVAGQTLTVTGKGFRPNTSGSIIWQSTGTNASSQQIGSFTSDGSGNFTVQAQVPNDKDRITNVYNYPNSLYATQNWSFGNLYLSDTFGLVLSKIVETIFIALMATTFAIIISLPLSFIAARNLMPRNVIGTTIYTLARTVLNILRSIEALILAVIFAATVGLGPFAGVLSLTVYAIASLGKFYSEAIEAIDPGPLEAITATGANRLQVITYAVIPQFIPQFIGFTLYMWDRSVRASTIVGFVGGGGIGFLLVQYINLLQFHQAGTAIWAIAIVVIIMDWASARIRARII